MIVVWRRLWPRGRVCFADSHDPRQASTDIYMPFGQRSNVRQYGYQFGMSPRAWYVDLVARLGPILTAAADGKDSTLKRKASEISKDGAEESEDAGAAAVVSSVFG